MSLVGLRMGTSLVVCDSMNQIHSLVRFHLSALFRYRLKKLETKRTALHTGNGLTFS